MRPVTVARALAGWCLLTAVGIALYWIMWWSTGHDEAWLPDGYVEHERAFVFTDAPLSVLLAATAVLLLRRSHWAPALALYTAGMLTFLGVIDTAYFAGTGMLQPEREGYANALIVTAVLGLAACLVVWASTEFRRERPPRPPEAKTAVLS